MPHRGNSGAKLGRIAEVTSSARAEARAEANVSQSVCASPAKRQRRFRSTRTKASLSTLNAELSGTVSQWRPAKGWPSPRGLNHRRALPRSRPPNPSLERTSTGKPLGPRAGSGHHPSRGPSAFPVGSAQLKR